MEGTTLYLLSGGQDRSQWVRNQRRAPLVTVRLRGRELSGRARVVAPDEQADAHARRLLLAKYGPGRDLAHWGRTALSVAVELSQG